MGPASGSDILSYQGNAALGAADTGNVGIIGVADLKTINDSLNTWAYLEMQKNKAIYDRKIKERDETFADLAQNASLTDQVLEEDRPLLNQKIDAIYKVYLDNNGDVRTNRKAWAEYQQKLNDFKEASTYAKSRFVEVAKQTGELAQERNPYLQEKRKQHLDNIKKQDLYAQVTPFQQMMDYDLNNIIYKLPTRTGQSTVEGDFMVTPYETDIDGARKLIESRYALNDKNGTGYQMQAWTNQFLGRDGIKPTEVVAQDINLVNSRLAKIRASLPDGDPNKSALSDIQVIQEADGNLSPVDRIPDLIWKFNVASQYGKGTSREFNKDISQAFKNRAQANAATTTAAAAMKKANAYSDTQRHLGDKYQAQTAAINRDTMPQQDFDEFVNKIETVKTSAGHYIDRVPYESLSANTQKTLGIEPLTATTTTGIGKNKTTSQQKFFNAVPVNIVTQSGNAVNFSDANNAYMKALKNGFEGSMGDFLRQSGATFDYEAMGRKRKDEPKSSGRGVIPKTTVQDLKEFTRGTRLGTYQNQQQGKTKNSLFLEDNSTPTETNDGVGNFENE